MLRRCFIVIYEKNINKQFIKSYCTKNTPLIQCKRPKFNYRGEGVKKKSNFSLASDGWFSRKSKGDYMILNPRQKVQTTTFESFEQCGISPDLVDVLTKFNFTKPTPIQEMAIPTILSGRNCIIAAETGCGKTLAYLIPILQHLCMWKSFMDGQSFNTPSALVLSPSRVLAHQIAEVIEPYCEALMLNSELVTGGHTKQYIRNAKFKDIDIVIASLGGFSKFVTNKIYDLRKLHHIVLDEADTLLDDSFNLKLSHFLEKINFAYENTFPPTGAQLSLVSATMPTNLPEIINRFIDIDSFEKITTSNLHMIPNMKQKFMRLSKVHRPIELLSIAKSDTNSRKPLMIFSNKTETCNWISLFLNEHGVKCIPLNSKMPVETRQENYKMFTSGKVNVISCTDIGSRGLDTTRARHILNYDFPHHIADYIHRCGRTGRVGSAENCHVTNFISFASEIHLVQKVELAVRKLKNLPNVDGNTTKLVDRFIQFKNEKYKFPPVSRSN